MVNQAADQFATWAFVKWAGYRANPGHLSSRAGQGRTWTLELGL